MSEAIIAENLRFSYLSQTGEESIPVFENLNLSIEKGSFVAVLGRNGCGKSTLGKLFLCEFPYSGDIRYGGKELSRMNRVKRTGIVGYLGHDSELFNDTVRNNILMGDEQLDPWESLR